MKFSFLNGNAIVGSIFFIISVIYGVMSLSFPKGQNEPGASFIPIILSVGLSICSLYVVYISFKDKKVDKKEKEAFKIDKKQWLLLLCLIIYLVSLPYAGFIPGTILFIIAVSKLFGFEGFIKPVLFSLIATAAIYSVFYIFLKVPLNSI